MRRLTLYVGLVAAFGLTILFAQSGPNTFRANLAGSNEVPAVSGVAAGEFHATLNADESELAWELEYAGLSGPATQAHIHFGQTFANGGIVLWLCGSADFPGPPNTQFCPAGTSGTVSGVAKAATVAPATAQGIAANEFAEVIQAIRRGNGYANIHTNQSKGGEVRGQIRAGLGRDGDKSGGKGSGKGRD